MKALCVAALLLLPASALASSDSSWADLDKRAKAACGVQIKKLAGAAKITKTDGTVSGIAGRDGDQYYGLLLSGTTAGYKSKWLCLFDKGTRKAEAREVSEP